MHCIRFSAIALAIVSFALANLHAQVFLNGSFENHKATPSADQINLSNAVFNTLMAHTFAFGTYGDVDIIHSGSYDTGPQHGNYYIALTGGGTDMVAMELSEPLTAGKTYTISFWDKAASAFTPQPFQVGVSSVNHDFGTLIYAAGLPVVGEWTSRSFTFTAPQAGKWITLRLGGSDNISEWAHCDNFIIEPSENSITIRNLPGDPFCPCSPLDVPFTSKGVFADGNVYTLQLSDRDGNFDNPLELGFMESSRNSGSIGGRLPCDSSGGSYRIRVVSSHPQVASNPVPVSLFNAQVDANVNISASPGTRVHAGTSMTFSAAATNAGRNPGYTWLVNGEERGGNSRSFVLAAPADGDVVKCRIDFADVCGGRHELESDPLTVEIIPHENASVTIAALPGNKILQGQSVTFRATPVNPGPRPDYTWYINGSPAGGNSSVLVSNAINDGDEVMVVMRTEVQGDVESNRIFISVTERPELADGVKVKSGGKKSGVAKSIASCFRKNFFIRVGKYKSVKNGRKKILHCHHF